jgi:hypothetical protein
MKRQRDEFANIIKKPKVQSEFLKEANRLLGSFYFVSVTQFG